MNTKNLMGCRVALTVSDPWEFGTECGTGPFRGSIIDGEGGKVLILLDKTISYGGMKYSFCICSPRHQGEHIKHILSGEKIDVNIMLISAKLASLNEVNQQSGYKTQAIIGTLEQA